MTSVAYAALWLFIFTLPWEAVISFSGVAVVSRLTGALALGIALVTVAITGRFRRPNLLHLAALLFVLWAALELLLFWTSARPPRKFWTYVQLCLVLWMMWELAPSWRRLLGLLVAYVFGSYVAAFETLLVYRRQAGALRRFTAGMTDPNDLAMTLALAVPMAWYLGMRHRQTLIRWACRVYLPVGILALTLTGSRGGLITTIVGLLVVPLTMDRLTSGRLVTAAILLSGAVGLAATYVPDTIVERLSTTGQELTDARFGGRFKLWMAGLNAFARRPMTGYGTGGFVAAVTPELGMRSNVAHNAFLSVLVEQGLVGLSFYLLMFVAAYRASLRLPKIERRFALTLLATLVVAVSSLTWEDRKPVWFILASLVGLSRAWVSAEHAVARPVSPRAAPRRPQSLTSPAREWDTIA